MPATAIDVRTRDDHLAEQRLTATLLGGMFSVFAGFALVPASIGLYAVVAHSICQRTQEIGIRMALGGTRGDLLRLACGLTDVLRIVLAGVSPGDPATFAMVTPVLAVAVFSEARFQRGGPWASIRRWLCDMSDTGDRGRWERSARR